ncbi:MAG TPA: lytic transglycosylase domain-containing protein [Gaiellaceae bacterium]|nr:lytic transglycosylase domain-containing protein [Gaiellaceae bacterium]
MRRLALLFAVVAAAGGAFVYLQRTEPAWWARLWYPLRYTAIVRGHAANYHLSPALLAAVIEQESKFDATARSSAGAIGLMQLTPQTAEGIAQYTGGKKFVLSDLTNPEINVRYGAWYLRHLLDKYHNERTALAAYNAGQQNVDRWRAEHVGVQFPETRAYVAGVERLKVIYRRAYATELGLGP